MLQSMRDKAKSWVTFVVVGIIAFMMAITGLETLGPNPNNPDVATVNGQDITRAQLAQALEQQHRMLIQQMGDQFDPSLIDERQLRESVLQTLIDRSLLLQSAETGSMEVGTETLDQMIVTMQEFQQDGRFNQNRFQMMVRSFGMSPLQFRTLLREETLLTQLQAGVAGSEFVTASEIKKLNALEQQTRDIAWLTLDAAAVRAAVTPEEEQIQEYYEANSNRYMTDEQVVARYIEMDLDSVAKAVVIDDQDVETEYQRRIQDLEEQASDKQRVATILIETGESRDLEEARARASEVVSRLNAGALFEDLAREFSDDPITASNGGDMGIVEPGFFGDEFDETVATLEPGAVSAPIETDFGLQILKVISREEAKIPALSEMRDEILAELKTQEASALFLDRSRQLADISFEASDLAQPAEQMGLEIKTVGPFGRNGGTDIAADPKVAAAAFSADVLELGANSELIELSPQRVMVLRVSEHLKPELRPLDEVRNSIVQSLKVEEARRQLQSRSERLIVELREGADADQLASDENLSWTESLKTTRIQAGVARQLLTQAFKMPHPQEGVSTFSTTELPNGDTAIIALKAVTAGQESIEDETRARMMATYIASDNGRNLFGEYLRSLKEGAKIKIETEEE